ncbi:MAG: hypothetical protein ACI38Z_03100 [Parafannyhessea sp.]|uniref:hypothetical protein n=1 Tax=Parafannyhessea sp. TaxID=2847324 RepID=UPI003F0F49D6
MSNYHRRAGRWRPLSAVVLCLVLLCALAAAVAIGPHVGKTAASQGETRGEKDGRAGASGGADATAGAGKGSGDAGARDGGSPAAASKGDGVSVRVMRGGVGTVAKKVLGDYEESSECVLARAGYVDLLGGVWSCTVVGDDWVDTVVVRAREDKLSCEVKTVRMDVSVWEREAAGL